MHEVADAVPGWIVDEVVAGNQIRLPPGNETNADIGSTAPGRSPEPIARIWPRRAYAFGSSLRARGPTGPRGSNGRRCRAPPQYRRDTGAPVGVRSPPRISPVVTANDARGGACLSCGACHIKISTTTEQRRNNKASETPRASTLHQILNNDNKASETPRACTSHQFFNNNGPNEDPRACTSHQIFNNNKASGTA